MEVTSLKTLGDYCSDILKGVASVIFYQINIYLSEAYHIKFEFAWGVKKKKDTFWFLIFFCK